MNHASSVVNLRLFSVWLRVVHLTLLVILVAIAVYTAWEPDTYSAVPGVQAYPMVDPTFNEPSPLGPMDNPLTFPVQPA